MFELESLTKETFRMYSSCSPIEDEASENSCSPDYGDDCNPEGSCGPQDGSCCNPYLD